MALPYDLTLLLDTNADDDARAKVLRDVEGAIAQAGGSITNNQDWGQKVLAFKVRHKPEAHYHLIQFTGPPDLPATLNRSLGINDVVLRHRIIRTPGGEPSAPPARPATPPAPRDGHRARPGLTGPPQEGRGCCRRSHETARRRQLPTERSTAGSDLRPGAREP